MNRGTMWLGGVLVALGLCGLLDGAGLAAWSQTAGEWWPLAIAGWALTEMVARRGISVESLIWLGLSVALLSDEQQWATGTVTWSALAAFVGLAVLTDALAKTSPSREIMSANEAGRAAGRGRS